MSRLLYLRGLFEVGKGDLDWEGDTIFVALVDANTFAQANEFFDDLTASEITATNYVGGHLGAGRKILTGKTVTVDSANGRISYKATIPTWSSLGGAVNDTIEAVIIAKQGSSDDSDATLIGLWDDPFPLTTVGEDLVLTSEPTGLLFHTPLVANAGGGFEIIPD